jgi:4-amino-4-deoxy-L-arabinose transferase-like glycosyltransferase
VASATGNGNTARRLLTGLLAAALLVRVFWGLSRPAGIDPGLPDQRDYLEMARNFLGGRGLQFDDARWGQKVWAGRPPGYAVFLAACGADVRRIRLAQALLDTSTVLAAYLLARRWLDRRRSLLAAALVAVNPFLIYFSALILTETLFTAMLAWGMALLLRRHAAARIAGAVLLAASVLVRPSAIVLPILLAAAATAANRAPGRAYSRWRPFAAAVAMAALTVAFLTPWAMRNQTRLGRWVWTTTNGGITAYDGFNDNATGASDQALLEIPPYLGELERDDYCRWRALEWIDEHPWQAVALAARKIARTWSPMPLSSGYARPLYRAAGLLYAVPLDLLVLWALCGGRLPRQAKLLLLLPAIYFTLVHALSVGSLRYRVPAEVPIAVIAAACGARTPKTPNPKP